ncbi:fungal hydrophobin-domain-containing protein [Ganoderma leucocontextum]|nr:fungal hydrophobin-domain-containing protein [Ganoderma leucocontextum]
MTRTVTDGAPAATVTVTKTQTDTDTDVLTQTAVGTQTTVTVSSTPSASPGPGGECNTGSLQCCDTVAPASSPDMSGILSALGVAVDVLNGLGDGLVGTSCSPISALSLGGGVECNQSPMCCNNNTYQGLINIGCVPIHL